MSLIKYNYPHIIVDYDFFSLPEIENAMAKFKHTGFTVAVVILERLLHRKGRIGLYKNLGPAARYLHMKTTNLIKVIDECGVFVADHEHGLFYSPRLRKAFSMSAYVSRAEAEDIAINGNVYLGWCKKHSRQKKHAADVRNNAVTEQKSMKNEASSDHGFKKVSKMNSESFKKEGAQSADNQAKLHSYKDKGISSKDIYTSNREFRKQVSSFFIDDADADNFYDKKLFLYTSENTYLHPPEKDMQINIPPGINTG